MKTNCFLLILVLSLLAVTINLISYDKDITFGKGVEAVQRIPLSMGDWQGKDSFLDPTVYELLETRAILHRNYVNHDGQEVFLSIVHYGETKVDFHAPEGCLGGRGIKTKKSSVVLDIKSGVGSGNPLAVNKLIQQQDNNTILVYYFYKTGDFVGPNYIKLRLNLILNKFRGGRKSGSLVRVSSRQTSNKNQEAHNNLEDFVKVLVPYLVEYL